MAYNQYETNHISQMHCNGRYKSLGGLNSASSLFVQYLIKMK